MGTPGSLDPLELARELIRCPSVTPVEGGALGVLERALGPLGFECVRLPFSQEGTPDVDNLYARIGASGPVFCFAGHTDVVPVGDAADWSADPFGGEVRDGRLWGRGACDMKAAVACFAAAVSRFLGERGPDFGGSISFLITGDEEGPAINGTPKMLQWMRDRGETVDACLVGEPTCPTRLGEMLKIGRRGSLNAKLTVHGVQGHTGYPQRADNPIPRLMRLLMALNDEPLDTGSEHFEPSTIAISSFDVGNSATNVIPAKAVSRFNIRFNDLHSGETLEKWLRERCEALLFDRRRPPELGSWELQVEVSGESFITPPGHLSRIIQDAAEKLTGIRPALSTSGGTSDARFIKDLGPVVEFGMVGETAHKVDENVTVEDVNALTEIYLEVLRRFFQ